MKSNYDKNNKSNEFLKLKTFNSSDSTNVYICMRRWDENCVNNEYWRQVALNQRVLETTIMDPIPLANQS